MAESVEVVRMAPESECEREMFVMVRWRKQVLAVPLAQLAGVDVDDETELAIGDWHYWIERGYRF